MTATATATAEEGVEVAPAPATTRESAAPKADNRRKKQPRYHVVLWNDDDHTYQYVIAMLQKLFGHPPEKGYLLAKEVDVEGACGTEARPDPRLRRRPPAGPLEGRDVGLDRARAGVG
jgi:ATP-dependent Clp protease adaptor protein ClpS